MDLLQDPEIKKTYEKCKYKVKLWEHEFTKTFKRVPSKLDIREAPVEVRHAYRKYFQLKTSALEQSFMDIDGFDEEVGQIQNFQGNEVETVSVGPLTELPRASNEVSPEPLSNNDTKSKSPEVWGPHLNRTPSGRENEKEHVVTNKVTQTIKSKLFCGAKFNKRNPRKSLSFSQKNKSEDNVDVAPFFSQPDNLPSAESDIGSFCDSSQYRVLQNKSQMSNSRPVNIAGFIDTKINNPTRTVDTGWLQRVVQNSRISMDNPELKAVPSKVDYDSDDIVEDSDDDEVSRKQPILHVAKKIKLSCDTVASLTLTNDPPAVAGEEKEESRIEKVANDISERKEKFDLTSKKQHPRGEKKPRSRKKTKNSEVNTSSTPRKSSRQNKVKISLEETPGISDEEDPFHSDNDERDPEFTVGGTSKRKTFGHFQHLVEEDTSGRSAKKSSKSAPRNKEAEPQHEDRYELEYCVKPRVVAPRSSNFIQLLKKTRPAKDKVDRSSSLVKSKRQQLKEKLEKKMESGHLNDNFVTINLRKKVFARGKSGVNYTKYKKAQWKKKKKALYGPDMDMGGCDGGKLVCFSCGQEGHFAARCKNGKGDGLLPADAADEECPVPTLEEASKMALDSALSVRVPKLALKNKTGVKDGEVEEEEGDEDGFSDDVDSELLAEVLKLEEHVRRLDVQTYVDETKLVKPYYELSCDDSIIDTPPEVFDALKKFGHSAFRDGQELAVMRILSGKSTLVTLSTGSGKSLCYQLPAYLYAQREPCISLIISPLVSLMEDQVTGIPKILKAACLHTNQTSTQRQKITEALWTKKLDVLLISPEAIVAGEKQTGFGSLFRKLPPIAFACIDEVHCISQWSHNFRPSYLMVCRVLKESLGVKTILGLTATATRATCENIIQLLDIRDGFRGIISDTPLPDNLCLTVSKDPNRDQSLLKLLQSERFKSCKSVIVYCTRRDECERIASFLRTTFKDDDLAVAAKKRKRLSAQAEPYHAGMSASKRRSVQNAFMSGELRIVVATVAFGMGINKADIRAVIHFNMPNSFESYVQEVGRAGRDGLPAHCHVFLDSQGRDENELRRHIHANSIDRHVIRKLLSKIFVPCACAGTCPKHEVAFSIEETIRALDIPEENVATLLCYLELHEKKYVEVLSPAYTRCRIVSYAGPNQLTRASKDCPPLAMALAMYKGKNNEDNIVEFPVVEVASAIGWDSGICKHKLKNLEWTAENNAPKRSCLNVQFSNLGFRLLAPGNLPEKDLDEALDSLYTKVIKQEGMALKQLTAIHDTLVEVARETHSVLDPSKDERLKSKIREYFNSTDPLKSISEVKPRIVKKEQLVNDIHAMVSMYRDNQFTGRVIARIFHGIQSPNYPAVIWGRCKFWRSHIGEDFHEICRIASQEIIRMR
ncbi:ATP-dependent DNA helicase Q4 [Cylas formicarius]|uniref:ATP-dependent DNA helicase Q4 n=1 Tax=Cylas formicarius TaxID=197179 RepID=UPI0029583254|nr:ATP-dependent DNA helicase Q4 [Cylas formicarius]